MWSDSDGTVPGHRIRRKEEEFVGNSIRERRWGYMWQSAVCERGGNRSNAQSTGTGRRRAEGAELPGEVFAGIPCSTAPTLGQQRLILSHRSAAQRLCSLLGNTLVRAWLTRRF